MRTETQFVDFDALKRAVSMVQILDRYGLMDRLHRSGDNLNGACPIHAGHNHTQFRVSISQNCWICFGDCHRGGSIVDFVSLKEGIGIRDAALQIQDWFGVSKPNSQDQSSTRKPNGKLVQVVPVPGFNRPLGFTLKNLDQNHPYLRDRGISEDTIKTFGLGYCQNGTMAGRIVIPIHNAAGKLVAYAGRWPGTPPQGSPKYKLPRGFRKSQELFNLHRALTTDPSTPLIVVEGFFGCIRLWQSGVKRVVALMGSMLSAAQEELIRQHSPPHGKVVLMLDEDAAGQAGRVEIRRRLAQSFQVQVYAFEKPGQQPEDLSPEQAKQAVA